jgi:glycosyltransferase involved in cell wall biosynthesis
MTANSSADAFQTTTVIVPMYNAAPYIAEAIESILCQTLPVSEIFVVDDGSTDNGCEIINRYSNVVLLKKDH